MPKEIEMTISCENDELIIIRDRKLIQKSWFLNRAAYAQDDKWLTKSIKFPNPVYIPYSKETCEFAFKYATKYSDARFGSKEENLLKFKEANKKNLEELRSILSCASFLQCQTFMNAISFVVAKKLEKRSTEEVQEFLGEGSEKVAAEFNMRTSDRERLEEYLGRNKVAKAENPMALEQSTASNTSTPAEHELSLEASVESKNESHNFVGQMEDISSGCFTSFQDLYSEFEMMFL